MQTVFRIKPQAKRARSETKRAFHSRKAHTKSRRGCLECKERRIKCDELQPECQNCAFKDVPCRYPTGKTQSQFECVALSTFEHDLTVGYLEARIADITHTAPSYRHVFSTIRMLRDLQHFNEVTATQLGLKANRGVLVASLCHGIWIKPTLMHLTLAAANVHAWRLRSTVADSACLERCMHAGAVHWQVALQSYSKDIQAVAKQRRGCTQDVDTVVTSTYLLTVMAFCIEDEVPPDIFINGNRAEIAAVMEPFAAAGSLQSLLKIVPELQTASCWRNVLGVIANTFKPIALEDLPVAFVELCELDSPDEDNLYYQILCHIVPLLALEPCAKQIPRLFGVIGRMWPALRHGLCEREPRTLLLLAWWLAVLHRVKVWWTLTRAETACSAIVRHLTLLDVPRLRPFLAYPASLAAVDHSWIWCSSESKAERLSSTTVYYVDEIVERALGD